MAEPKRAISVAELGEIFSNFNTTEGEAQGRAYQPAPSDIFVMTPAKCGTTWMQQIVHGLRTRGSMDFDEITCVVPWIEMAADMGIDIYTPQVASPRAFKTHLNLNTVPKGGKYIAVVRDPKDALLSLYRFFEGWVMEKGSIPIEEFARDFYVEGRNRGYWKHIQAFWDRRHDADVLALSYENMKQDLPGTIERVAEFMGIDLDDELRDIVVRQSDIKFMSEHNRQFDDHIVRETRNAACGIPADGVTSKVKNGNVGDSKRQVPQVILDEFDQIWREEITANFGLSSYEDLRQALM
ncbi:MAG TPA: sulfotransferase domain-containing protein [Anaerolineae bacterium]|nr:sulfotransferase domain-containing protein [Anaerolineae bacterium]